MTYQKLSNVNTPIDVVLQVYDAATDSMKFGLRDQEGQRFAVYDSYKDGKPCGTMLRMQYEDFKERFGNTHFWRLLDKAIEES